MRDTNQYNFMAFVRMVSKVSLRNPLADKGRIVHVSIISSDHWHFAKQRCVLF